MAESQKGTCSSDDPKDKKSLFDDEMGKEFLTSWNVTSVTDDDKIDFSFGQVSSGKKKAFNFEKLDMDFNLDGDFDKLSSFKVDMPDLDFTCPSNKPAKPNEKSGGESSSGNRLGKQDCFNFSFDFNELDDFKFDSTLMKGEKTSTMKPDSKGIASERGESQGSKLELVGGSNDFDDGQTEKLPASESLVTSMVETVVDGAGNGNSLNDDFSSRSGTSVDLVVSCGAKTSLEKTISAHVEETDQQSNFLEKAMAAEPSAQQTKQISPVQSLCGNDSTQGTISDVQTEVGYLGTKVNIESGAEHSVNDRMIAGVESYHETSEPTNSSLLYITGSERNRDKNEKTDSESPTENMIESEPLLEDLDLEATSAARLSQTTAHDCKAYKDIQNSTSKLVVPLRSELIVDDVAPIKEKDSGIVCSKSFQRSGKTETQLCQPLSIGVEASLFGKGIATMQSSHPQNGKREGLNAIDAQIGRKLVGDSKSLSRESTKAQPALLGIEKNVKNLFNIGEGFNGDGVQNGRKLVVNPRPLDKEVAEKDPVVLGCKKNTKNLNNFGSEANPASLTDKAAKSNTQTSVNSTVVVSKMGSNQNSKIMSVEELKAGKRTPAISSLKISRRVEASKDQSNATHQREINSLKNSQKNMEEQRNTASKIVHPVSSSERKLPVITSLKRKTLEASNADPMPLNPLKRLSQSPNESRILKEHLKSIVEEQFCDHDNCMESKTKNIPYDHPTFGPEISPVVSMKEIEIPMAMENDGNVEKAEAYAKELEDICNMLKKKHEEAKEILVRAIVNNNSLLMLNHPIFDEKIRMVEKFTARLMSH